MRIEHNPLLPNLMNIIDACVGSNLFQEYESKFLDEDCMIEDPSFSSYLEVTIAVHVAALIADELYSPLYGMNGLERLLRILVCYCFLRVVDTISLVCC